MDNNDSMLVSIEGSVSDELYSMKDLGVTYNDKISFLMKEYKDNKSKDLNELKKANKLTPEEQEFANLICATKNLSDSALNSIATNIEKAMSNMPNNFLSGQIKSNICHGCEGKGWLENSKGDLKICPVCKSKGSVNKEDKVEEDTKEKHIHLCNWPYYVDEMTTSSLYNPYITITYW